VHKFLSILLVYLLLSLSVHADDFIDGFEAAKKGDFKTAMKLWRPMAEQGHAKAQYNLGLMYARGDGVPEDDKQAVKWLRLAAEQGDAKAQAVLAYMYGEGDGISEDNKQAVKWYQLAAYIQAKRRSWCYVDEGGGSKKMISKLLSDID